MGEEVKIRSPPVQWAERKNLVYVFFHVTDTKKPKIKLDTDKLYFRARNGEGQEFETTLHFFKDVNVETSKYSVTDRGIDFILKKVEAGPYWNKLLKDNKKYPWLKIDFNRWRDEDDSDIDLNDESDFEEMMKRMSGLQSTSNDLNDLGSESDDEEEKV
ncbi:prostaglandin E synthase 3 isoform X1 [Parasteatoda tepidariorum]|uniref:prostaglandin E synthase 3 isoform X1 n=1 Tax=Parasteatoda tepidariorum TaxID=114398 RepID=UPI001C728D9F|nr:prostaglandin E synthase 3 isoform X1 [Parasteatoda tepidariorum]